MQTNAEQTAAQPAQLPKGARRPALPRDVAMRVAAREYELLTEQLRALPEVAWQQPTACPAWDVHRLACHVLGMAEFAASPVEQARQMAAAKRKGGLLVDALTALQVDKHVHRTPADVVARLAVVAPRAARGRRRTPALLRRVALGGQPIDETGTETEAWTLGYLTDVILTRDTWMHRSDVAAATGTAMRLAPDRDGVLVADIAAEWAARHGQPCTLVLTGRGRLVDVGARRAVLRAGRGGVLPDPLRPRDRRGPADDPRALLGAGRAGPRVCTRGATELLAPRRTPLR